MASIFQFRSRAQIYEDASLWLARLDKGLSAEARAELTAWLRAEPLHRQAFFELAGLWDELDVLAELSALLPLDQSAAVGTRSTRARWTVAAVAAGIACVAALGWVVAARFVPPATPIGAAAAQTLTESFKTTIGGQESEQLPDGSVVRLNTDTELTVVYSTAARNVFLRRGEAHFNVAHAADHPFRVHVGSRVVEAIGTAFNVHLRTDGEIEVTVTEGKVTVTRAGMAPTVPAAQKVEAIGIESLDATLVEGQVAILDEAATLGQAVPQITRLEPVDLDIKLAWQRGMLVFQGEPLQEMLAEVGRYTTTEFVLADTKLASVRVGGYFRAGDIDGLLVALRENFKIDSETTTDNRIVLRAAD
jgi:transmembrane sensor